MADSKRTVEAAPGLPRTWSSTAASPRRPELAHVRGAGLVAMNRCAVTAWATRLGRQPGNYCETG